MKRNIGVQRTKTGATSHQHYCFTYSTQDEEWTNETLLVGRSLLIRCQQSHCHLVRRVISEKRDNQDEFAWTQQNDEI